MNIKELYQYAWFSNLAYVKWNSDNTSSEKTEIEAANAAERIPGNARKSDINRLGNMIFTPTDRGGLGWKIRHYQPNDATGFAASLFSDGKEKVLAIRGTETDGKQMDLDLFRADLQEIGGLGTPLCQDTCRLPELG